MKHLSVLDFIDQCPPFLVAGLARMDGRPRKGVTMKYVAEKSGIPQRTIVRVLGRKSWSGVKLSVVDSIFRACNIDLWRIGRYRIYVRNTNSAHRPFRHMHQKQRAAMLRRMMEYSSAPST